MWRMNSVVLLRQFFTVRGLFLPLLLLLPPLVHFFFTGILLSAGVCVERLFSFLPCSSPATCSSDTLILDMELSTWGGGGHSRQSISARLHCFHWKQITRKKEQSKTMIVGLYMYMYV